MTNRLELNWKLDGFVDEQRYYCSETPIDPENLPTPTAILPGDVFTYTDSSQREVGKKYHVRVSAEKNGVEKISDEKVVLFGEVWTPANLANLSKLWLSAEDVATDSSNRISQATDLSGNNYHFTQTTNSLKPLLVVDTTLNLPVFKFDGTNDFLSNEDAQNISKNVDKLWVFAIHKRSDTALSTNCIFRYSVGLSSSNAGRFAAYAGTNQSGNQNSPGIGVRRLDSDSISAFYGSEDVGTEWTITLFYRDYSTAKSSVHVNSFEHSLVSGTAGNTSNTITSTKPAFFGTENAAGGFLSGSVAEMLSGNTELTQNDIDKLFGWAAHKYGLTDNLPVDHPYKILVPTV